MIGQLFSLTLLVAASTVSANWSYVQKGTDWPKEHPVCGGETQSPINIKTADVVDFKKPHPFKFSENFFRNVENATLDNNGYGYKIEFHDHDRLMSSSHLVGSPYRLLQVHIHFGSNKGLGSEHQINGVHYPAEIHFVFQSKYLPSTDMGHLAVLGFFVDVHDDARFTGGALSIWLNKVAEVAEEGSKTDISGVIDLSTIIPIRSKERMSRYFRYAGSLTTPPCSEIVQWTVFQDPIYISYEQYDKLLHGKRKSGKNIKNTYRLPTPLHGRTVYRSSFKGDL